MTYIIGQPKCVTVEFAGEKILFEIKDPTSDQIIKYLNDRMPVVGGKVTSNLIGAAIELVDKILVDVQGLQVLEDGKAVDLNNKTEGWLAKIPAHFKKAIAAKFDENTSELVQEAKPT
jgi:hypothetical protein